MKLTPWGWGPSRIFTQNQDQIPPSAKHWTCTLELQQPSASQVPSYTYLTRPIHRRWEFFSLFQFKEIPLSNPLSNLKRREKQVAVTHNILSWSQFPKARRIGDKSSKQSCSWLLLIPQGTYSQVHYICDVILNTKQWDTARCREGTKHLNFYLQL